MEQAGRFPPGEEPIRRVLATAARRGRLTVGNYCRFPVMNESPTLLSCPLVSVRPPQKNDRRGAARQKNESQFFHILLLPARDQHRPISQQGCGPGWKRFFRLSIRPCCRGSVKAQQGTAARGRPLHFRAAGFNQQLAVEQNAYADTWKSLRARQSGPLIF